LEQENQAEYVEECVAAFQSYLRAKGLRKTPERIAILRQAYRFETHFTQMDLWCVLKKNKYPVSYGTLYHTLRLFCDAGVLVKYKFTYQSVPEYEKSFRIRDHNHLVIEKTGKKIEFSDPRIHQVIEDIEKKHHVKVNRYTLTVMAEPLENE
jgi:Fur family ferric uptake transcriptional regulator